MYKNNAALLPLSSGRRRVVITVRCVAVLHCGERERRWLWVREKRASGGTVIMWDDVQEENDVAMLTVESEIP